MSGRFIVIEGLEGAGKTSAVSQVVSILKEQNIFDVVITREPGSTPLGEALRMIIKKGIGNEPITDFAELLMMYAARVQLVEQIIKPSLKRGSWVVSDRHDLSSQAYQCGGRGIDAHFLKTLRHVIMKDFCPDLTLYLDVPPKIGLSRVRTRSKLDRIEMELMPFFERTRACYQALAANNKQIITIDANQPFDTVISIIRQELTQWLRTRVLL